MATELAFCCGHCTKKMRVPVNFAGRKGMCPRCEAQFTIPTLEEIADAAPARLMVQPDAPPPDKKKKAEDDERTAHFSRSASGVATLANPGELIPFDPNTALDYKHSHQSSGAHRATAAKAPEPASSFELDYFAEPTGEPLAASAIEEVEAADLEQVETPPDASVAAVAYEAEALDVEPAQEEEWLEGEAAGHDAADPFEDDPIHAVEHVEDALAEDAADPFGADTADPFGADDDLGGMLVAAPLEADAPNADVSDAEVFEADILDTDVLGRAELLDVDLPEDDELVPLEVDDVAPREHAMADDAFDTPDALEALEPESLEPDALEPEVLEVESLDSVPVDPVPDGEPVRLDEIDLDVAIPAGATAMADGLVPLDSNDLLDAIDTAEIAPGAVEAAMADTSATSSPGTVDDDDEAIEFDPDALGVPDLDLGGTAAGVPADGGVARGNAGDDSASRSMGEDESEQWDGELAPPELSLDAPDLDVDLGPGADSGDSDLTPPDLEIPTGEFGEARATVETSDGSADVALTQILDLNDIMEVEEVEPPPPGLASMNPAQLLAHVKQLVQKGDRHKPSPELLDRLAHIEATPELVLARGHLRTRVGDDAGAIEDYLLAREKGKSDDASTSAIDRHEIDALLDQVNQFIDEEPARAANLLRGILAERPGYAKAHYFLGLSLLSCGEKPAALAELRTAAKLGYAVPELDALEYDLELANLEMLREKNPRMLLVKLPPFLARWSSSSRGYELLALALRAAGNRQSALEAYRKARSFGHISPDTDRIIYDLLIDLGRDDDAQLELEKHLGQANPDPFWVRVKFDQHFALKNHRESLDALCQLALFATDSLELQHNIRLMLASFEPMVAATALRKALTREPRHPVMSRLLADLLLTSGGYVEALDIYTQLLEAAPNHAGILLCRATCWQMMMPPQPDRALADLRLAFP